MVVVNAFLYYGYISTFHPVFVSLCQEDRDIYGRNDTWAMGRFLDIIIAMCRA